MAGGKDYLDSRGPYATALYPAVTLATTSKMLVPATPNTLVQPYEWFAGKKILVRLFGIATTGTTPGNITAEIRAATADAGGTILATSTAIAMGASKTNISWEAEFVVTCGATGSGGTSGSLLATGKFISNQLGLLIPAANNPLLIPESGVPAYTTVDLQTAAVGISFQVKRSGSTAETMQVVDQSFIHLN